MGEVKKQQKKTKKQQEASSKSLFHQTNHFFERNRKLFFAISMTAGALMSILLFDVKISMSGDDSEYLLSAENFWRRFQYPGSFGALYPIILSPIVGLFGYQFILLKTISYIFMLAFLWFFYKSIRGKVSDAVLCPTLLLVSINSFIFYYAGQTYSEALFMVTQALFFFYFFKHFIERKDNNVRLKSDRRKYVLLGCLILLMGLTRTIGYGAIGALILFFAIEKRWKELFFSVSAFFAVFVLFHSFKYLIWSGAGFGYDLHTILAKDHYNPIERESLLGFCHRFINNSHYYLSNCLCQFLGVIQERPSSQYNMNPIRTIVLYLLYFISIVILFKKNAPLLFSGIYVGVMLFATFLILHTVWGQDRFIMVYYPLILIFFLGGLYYLFQNARLQKIFFIYPLIVLIVGVGTLLTTTKKIDQNIPVLRENLLGDQFYGLTPDVRNFIAGSQWAAKNLDKNAVIVSRKPGISKVYTGSDFVWTPTAQAVSYETLTLMKNTDDHTILIVNDFFQNPYLNYIVSFKTPYLFKNKHVDGIFVYTVPNSEVEEVIQSALYQHMDYTLDYRSVFGSFRGDDVYISDPDLMLDYLIENNIRYLLLAQLRADPTRNTGIFINTTHRYLWYISVKYPNRFQIIHVEGREEPCEIVEFIR